MMKLITLILLTISNLALGQGIDLINKQAESQKLSELKKMDFACYKNKHLPKYSMTRTQNKLSINTPNTNYQLSFIFTSHDLKITDQSRSYFVPISDLNFKQGQFNLEIISKDLQYIECFVGAKAFFHRYDNHRNFIIHNHVQDRFYDSSKGFLTWYNNYATSFRGYPNLILQDGPSINNNFTITKNQINSLKQPKWSSDLLTGKLKETTYKTAPSGNIHLILGKRFNGSITIMGKAYNYCTTNLFTSIGRALLRSNRKVLQLNLPGYYNHHQKLGINNQLSLSFESEFNDIKTFKQKSPLEFERLFIEQKKLVENELNYQIEVLLKGSMPKTKLPKLIVNIY